jgi:hypothetical protein
VRRGPAAVLKQCLATVSLGVHARRRNSSIDLAGTRYAACVAVTAGGKRMTNVKLVVAALLSVAVLEGAASASQVWRCNYSGSWKSDDGNAGDLTWSVRWETRGASWHLIGEYTDRYGDSRFDGNCTAYKCTFKQHYTSGELAGHNFYWHGTYEDTGDGPGKTINRFTGTWGESPDRRDGTWKAKAVCVRTE